jgi:hypothetical protein
MSSAFTESTIEQAAIDRLEAIASQVSHLLRRGDATFRRGPHPFPLPEGEGKLF